MFGEEGGGPYSSCCFEVDRAVHNLHSWCCGEEVEVHIAPAVVRWAGLFIIYIADAVTRRVEV
jgi:hypothetical protein